jgi:cellulose biosynthesis protein BcsQ
MITVTSLSTKGGSGKTTLIQMLASGALARGLRVHALDGDTDQQLTEWRAKSDAADWNGLKRVSWPEGLTIGPIPETVDALYEALNGWEEEGVDLVLIDTRPGENPETENLALAADMIVVPAVPTQSDFVAVQKTLDWIDRMAATLAEGYPQPLRGVVMLNAPPKAMALVTAANEAELARARDKVHAQDLEVYEVVKRMPMLPTPVPTSQTFRRMPLSGPLTVVRDTYATDPRSRLAAGHIKAALDYCEELLVDIETAVKNREEAVA